MGEIDTSMVDVASVRLYWQKRSARYALSLLDNDVASTKVNNNDDADSRASVSFAGDSSSSPMSNSAPHNLPAIPPEINRSLFDGFDGENPMVLMAVSSDDCSPRHSSTCTPLPPFQANDISPIGHNHKDVISSARACGDKRETPMKAPAKSVQDWPDLQAHRSMGVDQNGNKVSSFCTATQTKLGHTCMAVIPDDKSNESDEENQLSPRTNKSSPTCMQAVFKERPELYGSNNTKAVIPRKYSIPTNSLLFERLEKRVGKQIRSRANNAGR